MDTLFPQGSNLFSIPNDAKPIIKNNTFHAYINLLNNIIYIPSSDDNNIIIHGTVIIKMLKSCQVDHINLNLNGKFDLDWPEGILIDEKKVYHESNELINIDYLLYQRHIKQNYKYNHSTSDLLNLVDKKDGSPSSKRRYSDSKVIEQDDALNIFQKGSQYTFTFRYILPNSTFLQDSIKTDYSSVKYQLSLFITYTPLKSRNYNKISLLLSSSSSHNSKESKGNHPLTFIHIPSNIILDDYESIIINNNWKDALIYEIIIGNKNILLNAYLPISIHLIPMEKKIAIRKINIFLEEKITYGSISNPKLRRNCTRKHYILLQHSATIFKGKSKNLLYSNGNNIADDGIENKLLQYDVFVPYCFNSYKKLHPDQITESKIKISHWIKFELYVTSNDKNFTIIIDTPVTVLNKLCSNSNLLLPNYNDVLNIPNNTTPPVYNLSNRFFPQEVLQSDTISNKLHANDAVLPSVVINDSNQKERKNKNNNIKKYSHPLINSPSLQNNIYQPLSLSSELTTLQAIPKYNNASSNFIEDTLIMPPTYENIFFTNEEVNTITKEINSNITEQLSKFEFNSDVSEHDLTEYRLTDSWFPKSLIK
ncbi:hypothetical protein MOSE0_J06634 [Monosporozyma servazzii]